jgi:hypothetical protein
VYVGDGIPLLKLSDVLFSTLLMQIEALVVNDTCYLKKTSRENHEVYENFLADSRARWSALQKNRALVRQVGMVTQDANGYRAKKQQTIVSSEKRGRGLDESGPLEKTATTRSQKKRLCHNIPPLKSDNNNHIAGSLSAEVRATQKFRDFLLSVMT